MRPKLLLADEPTGNLDTASGKVVLELLGELNDEGLTLVVVTHNPTVARHADRILVLVDGRLTRRLRRDQVNEVISLLGDEEESGQE